MVLSLRSDWTIHPVQVDVPTLELIDLPGVQVFPEESQSCTTNLVSAYLNKPDTLVLCVVDATIPSLTDSVALGMVRAANKLPNTILALTKSDLVRSEFEIVERIFERVLGSSSDNQYLSGLAGCVAVANRNHTDHLSLVEADVEERCCFKAMLDDPAEAYAPAEIQQKLKDNMTIRQLILKVDRLFHNFIVKRWEACCAHLLGAHERVNTGKLLFCKGCYSISTGVAAWNFAAYPLFVPECLATTQSQHVISCNCLICEPQHVISCILIACIIMSFISCHCAHRMC